MVYADKCHLFMPFNFYIKFYCKISSPSFSIYGLDKDDKYYSASV